jgi:chromosome transmission fidelity protein 8
MDIGLHLLEGNVVNLKLPLLAIEKKRTRAVAENGMEESCEDDISGKASSSLEIVGVIRKKIIFKTRPKPTCTVNRI